MWVVDLVSSARRRLAPLREHVTAAGTDDVAAVRAIVEVPSLDGLLDKDGRRVLLVRI